MAFVRQELEHSDQNLNQIGGGSTDATDQGGDKRRANPAATRATPTATAVTTVTTSGAGVVAAGSGGRAAQGSFATKKSAAHWRKIRSAVSALAAFRRRKVKTTDFERIRLCGEGGSGLVYLVKLKDTSMFFALKVQRKLDLEAKEKRIRRAMIEKEVLVACAHPFVCSLYTAFQDSRHLYLVMDYCAGGDLNSLVRNVVKRPLKEEEALFYISEIVAALEWVHLNGYVYRDLKPENVLIHASGHIRLGDFGTAERGSIGCCDTRRGSKLRKADVEKAICDSSGGRGVCNAKSDLQDSIKGAAAAVREGIVALRGPVRGRRRARFRHMIGLPPAQNGLGGEEEEQEEEEEEEEEGEGEEMDEEDHFICDVRPRGDTDVESLLVDSTVVNLDPLMEQGGGFSRDEDILPAHAQDLADGLAPDRGDGRPHAHAEANANAIAGGSGTDDGAAAAAAAAAVGASDFAGSTTESGQPCPDVNRSGLEERSKREAVGCGCLGRGARAQKKPADILAAPSGRSHAFAKGRGSVKLNVILDSQTFIGTADFMAPEMITGKEKQGTALDWWALGVIMYEISLGTLPFHSEMAQTSNDVFRSIVNADLTFPRRHPLSRSAVDFIRQLLQKNPAERLGERKGVGEIKRHRFLRSVHWALIANSKPPFVLAGPDSPDWAASLASASPESRKEKMAAWTWMATRDGSRPAKPIGTAHAAGRVQDSLDLQNGTSRYHGEADLSKLGEELEISAAAGPKVLVAGAEAVGGGGSRDTPPVDAVGGVRVGDGGGGDGGGGGSDLPMGLKAGMYGMGRTVSVSPKNAADAPVETPASAAASPVLVAAAAPAAEPARQAHSAVAVEAAAAPTVEAVPAPAPAAKRLGSPPIGGKRKGDQGEGGQETKPNFDGYDFNTIRRVGSVGLPRLSASKSSGSARSPVDQPKLSATRSAGGAIL